MKRSDHNMRMTTSAFSRSVWWMIAASAAIGYFTMTVLLDSNKTWNLNKIYQALLMGATMGLVMVFLMPGPRAVRFRWAAALTVVSAVLVVLIRRQVFVYDRQFARSMIEHHAMAVVMARRLREKPGRDAFISQLATNIETSQLREIADMRAWLATQEQTL